MGAGADDRDATIRGADGTRRCRWCAEDEAYRAYHDTEWGRPVVDEVRCFEKLCLEGFQAGLSWITILRKRDAFREAFAGFDPEIVAGFGPGEVDRLLRNASIIRHRGKIESAIHNARVTLDVLERRASLAGLLWSFEPARRGRTVPEGAGDVPAVTAQSTACSAALRREGYKFVGPTTCYAAMQSLGIVNDHFRLCAMRKACEAERRQVVIPAVVA